MREIQAFANAGIEPRPHILGALDGIRALIAAPYAPTSSAIDKRFFILDLSEFNNVDMRVVSAFADPQVKAVIIRLCGSASVRDTKFKAFWDLARELGMKRSIYMYNYPGYSVDAHISNFMAAAELWTPGDLGEGPIWVDAELHANKTRKQVSDHTIGCISGLASETGKVTGWYSGTWFVDGYMELQDWMKDKWAWWAQWLTNQPKEHPGPVSHPSIIPDGMIAIHQTGSNGNAALFGGSGRVDTDRWQASEDTFYELFGGDPPAPPPGDLTEQVNRNTQDIAELYERINVIDEWVRSYNE